MEIVPHTEQRQAAGSVVEYAAVSGFASRRRRIWSLKINGANQEKMQMESNVRI